MQNNKQVKKRGMAGKVIRTIISVLLAIIILAVMVLANTVLATNARMVDNLVGYNKRVDNKNVNAEGLDLDYYKADYTEEEIAEAEEAMHQQILAEGTVLLKNDAGSLPYQLDTTFSFVSSGINGSQGLLASLLGSGTPLKDVFETEGFAVNTTLWDFYTEGGGKDYLLGPGSVSFGSSEDFSINECPLSVLEAEEGLLDSLEGTVPVFVLSRVAGEGRDMPRSMYMHTDVAEDKTKSYIEPNSDELEILDYLNSHFDDVVILVQSNAALELGWIEDYDNINTVVFAPNAGDALAGIFSGSVNPSGRTVDTFAADALASPAAQNFGSYAYHTEDGKVSKYNYISYKEGIYVGYKYYETHYEDVVLDQGNAGDFDYAAEVCYPFGYGLSYTTFEWSDFATTWQDGVCTVTVTVKNTGDVAGKDVVQIYAQSPYTDYDKANNIEKAAAELVAFGKTEELEPGKSETLSITFNEEQLKSYDASQAKTYILEAGDYYITAGTDAHSAVNNILAAKGHTEEEGMTAAGNADLVALYNPDIDDVDATTYATDSYSGADITNLFDDAKGDVTYLSRQDWQGSWPSHDGEASDVLSTWGNEINGTDADGNPAPFQYYKTATDDEIAKLDAYESNNPTDPETLTDEPVYGADNGRELIEMRGLTFDDPQWDELLDQLTPDDYFNLIAQSGYGTIALDSVGKPFCVDADTASGLVYGGTRKMFPVVMMLAQTFNQELALDYGTMIGNEALLGGANGWYAPSMNIHRTPFSGRNGEYYSEDGYLSGAIAEASVNGAASKGMYTFIKHYAINDQENHRGDRDGQFGLVTWANEQSIREIYLLPFEMSLKADDIELNYLEKQADGSFKNVTKPFKSGQAVMSAFNRIGYTWTGGSYELITGILRNEWDFNGFIITDNANTGLFIDAYQMIEAGADGKLTNLEESARFTFEEDNKAHYHYGKAAAHRILYTVANSNAMNGAMPGSLFVEGLQLTQKIRIGVNVIGTLLLALMVWLTVRRFRKKPIVVETEITQPKE